MPAPGRMPPYVFSTLYRRTWPGECREKHVRVPLLPALHWEICPCAGLSPTGTMRPLPSSASSTAFSRTEMPGVLSSGASGAGFGRCRECVLCQSDRVQAQIRV